MADIEEKNPTSLWGFMVFLCIEVILIVCLVPNVWIDKSIVKERQWVEMSIGAPSASDLIQTTDSLYTNSFIETGIQETISTFFIPSAEEREKNPEWENLARLWMPFIENRGDALMKVTYHILYRAQLLLMWAPYVLIILVPSIFSGYMTWNIKRYTFAYSSPLLNQYSSKLIWLSGAGILLSFITPLPIPPMVIPTLIILFIPLAAGLLIGNLPKRI